MFDEIVLGREFFEGLVAIDEAIVAQAAKQPCRFCGGPLHRSDYARKPRGGLIAAVGEDLAQRFSLCCGWEGCRRRAMPPSVRFLGRRVYLGAAMIMASVIALSVATAAAIRRATGIAARTTRRWLGWWRGPFTTTSVYVALCARLVAAPSRTTLPKSLLVALSGDARDGVSKLLLWLMPITASEGCGSHWSGGLVPT
jgi:hypothetical protein